MHTKTSGESLRTSGLTLPRVMTTRALLQTVTTSLVTPVTVIATRTFCNVGHHVTRLETLVTVVNQEHILQCMTYNKNNTSFYMAAVLSQSGSSRKVLDE